MLSRIYRDGDVLKVEGPKGITAEFSAGGSPWPSSSAPLVREFRVLDVTIDLAGEDELAAVAVATIPGPVKYVAIALIEVTALTGDVTTLDLSSDDLAALLPSFTAAGAGTTLKHFAPALNVVSDGDDDDVTLALDDACVSGSVRVVIVYETLL